MITLVERVGWTLRTAAFALAALHARRAGKRRRNDIDAGELRRIAREGLDSRAAKKIVRRARAILRAYQRMVQVRARIERLEPEDLRPGKVSPRVLKLLNAQWGPAPWTDEEERPGPVCPCAKPWPFCPDCRTFIPADSKHICKAKPVLVPLDHPHRHCGLCNVPAPEPEVEGAVIAGRDGGGIRESGWCVQVPVQGDVATIAVTGSWLVSPVARVDPVSLRREVFGWACSAHREEAWKRVPPVDEATRIKLVPGFSGRIATRRKKLHFDERKAAASSDDSAEERAERANADLERRIDDAWGRPRSLRSRRPPM